MRLTPLFTLLLPCLLFAQGKKSLLDSIVIDKGTRLVGMYPPYDKDQTYKMLNFLIEDEAAIKAVAGQLTYGEPVKKILETNGFDIMIVQDHKSIANFIFSPAFSTIIVSGKYYAFDPGILKKLNADHAFDYDVYSMEFPSEKAYNTYLESLNGNPQFLFSYPPDFKYEGSFELSFPKTDLLNSPKAVADYLNAILPETAGTDAYHVTYNLTDYNKENPGQYTMSIEGSRKLFNTIALDKTEKKNWTDNVPKASFFMKKQ